MPTEDTMQALLNYFSNARHVGHTRAMIRGAANSGAVAVLVPNHRIGHHLIKPQAPDVRIVTLSSLDRLMGARQPLLMDHTTIEILMRDAVSSIGQLRARNDELENLILEMGEQVPSPS